MKSVERRERYCANVHRQTHKYARILRTCTFESPNPRNCGHAKGKGSAGRRKRRGTKLHMNKIRQESFCGYYSGWNRVMYALSVFVVVGSCNVYSAIGHFYYICIPYGRSFLEFSRREHTKMHSITPAIYGI